MLMHTNTIFPWQKKQWHLLWEAKQKNRLPHALLFAGALGLGKMQFAETFSAVLLCEKPILEACGACHACRLVQAKSHPDLIFITPEQTGQAIKIDQIRSMVDVVNETALQGGYKIIIINPAHAMNQHAANALLKTLEEATPKTLFILISEQNLRLPLTILSRCQKIIFQKPEKKEALAWLKSKLINSEVDLELALNVADGAPLQALALIEKDVMALRQDIYQGLFDLSQNKADFLQLAARWQEYDIVIVFNLLLNWLRDLLRLQLTQHSAMLINYDYQTAFSHLVQGISQKNLLHYLAIVQERYSQILNLQNLNKQLLLEELLGSVYNSTMSGVLP
jgi:DNA polymerase-3 subunit delta'